MTPIREPLVPVRRHAPQWQLRDRVVQQLLGQESLTSTQVAFLKARDVLQHEANGELYLRIITSESTSYLFLSADQSQCLLEYMEAFRLWNTDGPLLIGRTGEPLTPRSLRSVRRRYRRKIR